MLTLIITDLKKDFIRMKKKKKNGKKKKRENSTFESLFVYYNLHLYLLFMLHLLF